MTDKDAVKFAECMGVLADVFGRDVTEGMTAGYWVALENLEIDQVQQATTKAIRECVHFPRPSELIGFVSKSVEQRALEAWTNVMQYVNGATVRTAAAIDLGDPAANAALRAIGGVNHVALQGTDSEHEKFTRPRFIEAFKAFAESSELGVKSQAVKCLGSGPKLVIGNGGATAIEYKPEPFALELAEKMRIGSDA